jgi:hypothetical protein
MLHNIYSIQALLGRPLERDNQGDNSKESKGKTILQAIHYSLYIPHLTMMFSRSLTRGVGASMRNVQVSARRMEWKM